MRKKIKILIVDDDQVDQMALKRALKHSELLTDSFSVDNASEALKLMEKESFDCCFIDYIMPDMNGIELVKRIRKNDFRGTIIVVTSQSDPELSKQALKAGANNYITKSLINPEAISLLLRNAMEMQKIELELKDARQEAVHHAEMKQKFLANMSHEIRTPMNAVLGFSRLLTEFDLDKKAAEYVQTIYTSAENLLIIINDVLDVSKIESGKLSIENIDFDLKKTIYNVKNMLDNIAKNKNLYLNIEEPENSWHQYIVGDPYRINQILLNLVNNAIKFTNEGGVTISISQEQASESSVQTKIEVIDTGIGIKKEAQKAVFESFNQEDAETTRKFGGTGLGLTISKQLVEIMNGQIGLVSEVGKGSNFHFTITNEISGENANNKLYQDKNTNGEIIDLSSSKILLVDDNEVNRELAEIYLKRLNCQLDFAENGQVAIDKALANKYDLIFMDIQMPIKDGVSATKEILEHNDNINIVGMSAHVLKEEIDRCMHAGMKDYLIKPFKSEDLYSICYKYLVPVDSTKSNDTLIYKNDVSKENIEEGKLITTNNDDIGAILKTIELEEGKDFVTAMTRVYLKRIPNDIIEIENAIKDKDLKVIEQKAHLLVGSLSAISFNFGAELAKNLESISKTKSSDETVVLANKLVEYLTLSIPTIKKHCQL